jgi:hypothetical protein
MRSPICPSRFRTRRAAGSVRRGCTRTHLRTAPTGSCPTMSLVVSNGEEDRRMAEGSQFRKRLPVAQTVLATFLGGWGLWLRNEILSHSWMGWNSTARFHAWPWPLKFVAIVNMPAFLAGSLLSWPIYNLRLELPESVEALASLVFVPLLWYWIGSWLDQRWDLREKAGNPSKRPWILLLVFTLVCAVGASIPITSVTSYTSYLPYGIAVWVIVGFGMAASAKVAV